MNASHRTLLKKFTYLITGITAIIASVYISFMTTSMAMAIFVLAIAFITRPIAAFIPVIFYGYFIVFIFFCWIFIYAKLMPKMARFARKSLIKLLKLDKNMLAQLKRIDPFNAVWLWGYLLPFLIAWIIAIPTT